MESSHVQSQSTAKRSRPGVSLRTRYVTLGMVEIFLTLSFFHPLLNKQIILHLKARSFSSQPESISPQHAVNHDLSLRLVLLSCRSLPSLHLPTSPVIYSYSKYCNDRDRRTRRCTHSDAMQGSKQTKAWLHFPPAVSKSTANVGRQPHQTAATYSNYDNAGELDDVT